VEHTEIWGAIAQKGKKLETKQNCKKYHVYHPINNTSNYLAQRNHIEAQCECRVYSQGKVEHRTCIQELTDIIGICRFLHRRLLPGKLSNQRNLTAEKSLLFISLSHNMNTRE
jgi:hypothetical protein